MIIENREIGGASLNWGSLPKKIMWSLAAHLVEGRVVQHYGVESDPKFDFAKFRTRLQGVVVGLRSQELAELSELGIDLVPG